MAVFALLWRILLRSAEQRCSGTLYHRTAPCTVTRESLRILFYIPDYNNLFVRSKLCTFISVDMPGKVQKGSDFQSNWQNTTNLRLLRDLSDLLTINISPPDDVGKFLSSCPRPFVYFPLWSHFRTTDHQTRTLLHYSAEFDLVYSYRRKFRSRHLGLKFGQEPEDWLTFSMLVTAFCR